MSNQPTKTRFIPLVYKVDIIIVATLVVGIGAITAYFAQALFFTLNRTTQDNLNQHSALIYAAIENFMMPGEATLAVQFMGETEQIDPEYMVRLYRRDGRLAFSDSSTVETVNANLGRVVFEVGRRLQNAEESPLREFFGRAVRLPPEDVHFKTAAEGETFLHIYKPLVNLPKCTPCHGAGHTIRGVIAIRKNVTEETSRQRFALTLSASLFLGMVVVLAGVLTQFMRRSVIEPVRVVGEVCSEVTRGRFDRRVSIKNHDELGQLANTVNAMVEGLYERYELSKFVSSSTVRSLRDDRGGRKIGLTLLFTDIRGFTAYTERQEATTVVNYLNKILNFQTEVIHKYGGDVDKYVGDEIVAIFSEADSELAACAAAVEIQREIEQKHATDFGGLRVGIGINAGEVILGMVGSEKRADFTVIGDNVNSAARLCSVARRGQTLISDSVFVKVKGSVTSEGPYRLKVKGKERYLRVHSLKSIKAESQEA